MPRACGERWLRPGASPRSRNEAHELEPDRLRKWHGSRGARDRVQPMRYTARIARADDDDRTVQGHSHRRRVATPAHSGAIPGDALSWHGAAGELCAASRKAAWHIFMCRMRSTAVPIEIEIRERHRVAKLQRTGRKRGRDFSRSRLRHGANRGALRELREPPRPRLRRRSPSHRLAMLHQRHRDEFCARLTEPAVVHRCRTARARTNWLESDAYGEPALA